MLSAGYSTYLISEIVSILKLLLFNPLGSGTHDQGVSMQRGIPVPTRSADHLPVEALWHGKTLAPGACF